MRLFVVMVVVILSLAAPACQQGHQHSHSHDAAMPAAATAAAVIEPTRRFEADASTTAAVARMRVLVDAPEAANDDVVALRTLGKGLRGELHALISGCTMTGEAHERLHAWLEPVLADVGTLETGEVSQAIAARESMRRRLADFATTFE